MDITANFSFDHSMMVCGYLYMTWTFLYMLSLPVFMFVLYIGFEQWRARHSRTTTISHSDIFTFNIAVVEVISILGSFLFTAYLFTYDYSLKILGENIIYMMTFGQILFHNLVCVERYLAVVHPITYLRLKRKLNGVVIRNVCIVGVWLFSICLGSLCNFRNILLNLLSVFIIAMLSLAFVGFFSANVLCVLIRPGPGEGGGDRRHTDQSKRRAFFTMAAITVALLFKFAIMFVLCIIFFTKMLNEFTICLLSVTAQWLNILNSLVLPVLFLHRQAKLHKMVKIKQ